MFCEEAESFQGAFGAFAPYPAAAQRGGWEDIDGEAANALVRRGEGFLGYEYPYLKASDFMEFSRTGNRTRYENRLFAKRRALSALVLAECAEHKGRFLTDAINGIYAICNEAAWQAPAHNAYIRDARQLPLPDVTRPVIELFSCETAAVLATAYYLLREELDAVSPFIGTMIHAELEKRVIAPYLTEHFWWMGRGDEPMCNWTVWCTQNVLLSVFLIPWEASVREKVFYKAAESIDFFLKDYGEDGCCEEGAQYYRHAGLCLFQSLDILCRITDGHFARLWQEEKIKNIASYIFNVHVDGKYYMNFADCSPVAGRAGAREFLFGKACGISDLMKFAAIDYRENENLLSPEENNLYYRLQEVFARKEMLRYDIAPAPGHRSVYYPSVGLFVARNERYVLGAKGGDNGDSHNHNDTGSITVYKDGLPLLIDVGVESYTAKTFSPQRYEIWTMQSDYHNLPTLNGQMQQNGKEFCAAVSDWGFAQKGGSIRMDIAGAYPAQAGIASYVRSVTLDETGIRLTDCWRFREGCGREVVLNFMTYEEPRQEQGGIRIGGLGSIRWECCAEPACEGAPGGCGMGAAGMPGAQIEIEELPIADERLALCWKHGIYRIRLTPPQDCCAVCVRIA